MEKPNLIYIHSLSQGDTAFVDKIIKILKTEFQDEKKIYYKNLEENNYLKTAEWVHKIKHKISILGLLESYAIAEEFENNLKENNTKLKEEFQKTMQLMTDYLNTL